MHYNVQNINTRSPCDGTCYCSDCILLLNILYVGFSFCQLMMGQEPVEYMVM